MNPTRAINDYMEEMRKITDIRRECSIREIEAWRVLYLELEGDNPEKVHSVFQKPKGII